MSKRCLAIFATFAAVLSVITACGKSDAGPATIVSAGLDALPSSTASDWKSYGDLVVKASVLSESEVAAATTGDDTDSPLVARTIRIRVDHLFWARAGGPKPPDPFVIQAPGWVRKSGKRIPMVTDDAPRLEVGHTYLLALARFADEDLPDGWAWDSTGSNGAAPFEHDVVGEGEWLGNPKKYAEAGSMLAVTMGKSSEAVAAALARAKADPLAARYGSLDPFSRRKKVMAVQAQASAAATR